MRAPVVSGPAVRCAAAWRTGNVGAAARPRSSPPAQRSRSRRAPVRGAVRTAEQGRRPRPERSGRRTRQAGPMWVSWLQGQIPPPRPAPSDTESWAGAGRSGVRALRLPRSTPPAGLSPAAPALPSPAAHAGPASSSGRAPRPAWSLPAWRWAPSGWLQVQVPARPAPTARDPARPRPRGQPGAGTTAPLPTAAARPGPRRSPRRQGPHGADRPGVPVAPGGHRGFRATERLWRRVRERHRDGAARAGGRPTRRARRAEGRSPR